MNIYHKLGCFSFGMQLICALLTLSTEYDILFLSINILFLNTTMAFWYLGNNRNYAHALEGEQNG